MAQDKALPLASVPCGRAVMRPVRQRFFRDNTEGAARKRPIRERTTGTTREERQFKPRRVDVRETNLAHGRGQDALFGRSD